MSPSPGPQVFQGFRMRHQKNCRQQLTDKRPQFLDESCNLIWTSFHLLWSNLPFGVVPVFHLKGSEAQHHSLSFEIQAKRQGLPPYRAHSVFLFFFVSSHQAMTSHSTLTSYLFMSWLSLDIYGYMASLPISSRSTHLEGVIYGKIVTTCHCPPLEDSSCFVCLDSRLDI